MRFYIKQMTLEETKEDLDRIYVKLNHYQENIQNVYQKLDWNMEQIRSSIHELQEQTSSLEKMKSSLVKILFCYCKTEEIIAAKGRGLSRSLEMGYRWPHLIGDLINWVGMIDDPKTRDLLCQYSDYTKIIQEAYENASGTSKELYDKYRDDIQIASMEAESSYHKKGSIYIDYEQNIDDPRGAQMIYYHETGHFIVGKEGWVAGKDMSTEFQKFDQAVKKDVSDYIARIENEQRIKYSESYSGKQLEQVVTQAVTDYLKQELGKDNTHIYNGVSDMIDAASNGKYNITYGHADDYWDANPTRQANEAFAHMFSADFCKDMKETEYMKYHFPNAYREYENLKNLALN